MCQSVLFLMYPLKRDSPGRLPVYELDENGNEDQLNRAGPPSPPGAIANRQIISATIGTYSRARIQLHIFWGDRLKQALRNICEGI